MFTAREQFGSPPRLILEIDIGELLAAAVLHNEGRTLNVSANVLDGPGRREAVSFVMN
jgi:hypothetical protein